MQVFHRRWIINSCIKVKPKEKHRWLISSQEVLLDQAWSSTLINKLSNRLELESRAPTLWTHIAVIVRTTRNSSKGDVYFSNTEWRKRCKIRAACSNRFRLLRGQVSDLLNWVLEARTKIVTVDMLELFNPMGSPCTSDQIVILEVLGLEATSEWLTLPIVRIRLGCMEDSVLPMDQLPVPRQRWALSLAEMARVKNIDEKRIFNVVSRETTQKRPKKSKRKSNLKISSNFSRCLIVWNT